MNKSEFGKIDGKDLRRALFLVIGTFFVFVATGFDTGNLPGVKELQSWGIKAFSVGILYLGKNLLTNSNDEILKKG
jgi:hypothetical protein